MPTKDRLLLSFNMEFHVFITYVIMSGLDQIMVTIVYGLW
jgi:hypothetical protein